MKVKTRKGDRLLVWSKHGTLIHTLILDKGHVEVVTKPK
jgi:hypothetical protein